MPLHGLLPKLTPDLNEGVNIQKTSLALDTLARFYCNTFDEVITNGHAHFDYIVIGSGMYGSYAASKLFRLSGPQKPRVLVLEAGPFLLSEHVQNYSRSLGFGVFDAIYGKPYTSNVHNGAIANHYYCVGGKSLGWGKWCPRMTSNDLQHWPADVVNYLNENYEIVEIETGVKPADEFIFGPLHNKIFDTFSNEFTNVPGFTFVMEPPIAAQAQAPASGLFSFDAYSSITLLLDAIRDDISSRIDPSPDSRKIILIPKARAYQLDISNNEVKGIRLCYGDNQEEKYISTLGTRVILAAGCAESTRLVLNSIPKEPANTILTGRNLMAHLRSNYDVRVHKSVFGNDLPELLQVSALHVQGELNNRRFHVQLFAAADTGNAGADLLYRMVRDIDDLKALLETQKSDWISFRVLTCGEMVGKPNEPVYTNGTNWMDLSPYEYDQWHNTKYHKAFLHLELSPEDDQFWHQMDQKAMELMLQIVSDNTKIEIRQHKHANQWSPTLPPDLREFRDSLGSTYHESGTLWMGTDAAHSVTNTSGRFHHYNNLYCVDQSIFPTVGSANPVLTGLVVTRKIVTDLLGGQIEEEPVLIERLSAILEQTNYEIGSMTNAIKPVRKRSTSKALVENFSAGNDDMETKPIEKPALSLLAKSVIQAVDKLNVIKK